MYLKFRRPLLGLAAAALALSGLGLGAGAPALATTAEQPLPAAEAQQIAAIPPVNSTTTMIPWLVPTEYGTPLFVGGTIMLDGPANASGTMIELWVDGVLVAQSPLLYNGSGGFVTLMPLSHSSPSAGEHTAIVKYPGFISTDPAMAGILPSESAPFTFTVAPITSTTTILSAPSEGNAFAPVEVTASVTVTSQAATGTAALLVDDTEIARTTVQPATGPAAAATAQFSGARLPASGNTLWVKYLGSDDGNVAPSQSARGSLRIDPLDTSVDVTLSPSQIRADASTTLDITVTNETLRSSQDPVGGIEVLVDGEVAVTMAQDEDPQAGNGVARFSVPLGGNDLGLGAHDISVNFIPAPGFTASSSTTVPLTVFGVPTALMLGANTVTGTPSEPPIVSVQAAAEPANGASTAVGVQAAVPQDPDHPAAPVAGVAGAAFDGSVQAFTGGGPLGDPVTLVDGAAAVPLRGLAVGSHDVEIRFTPAADSNALPASTTVTAVVSADAAPKPKPEKPEPGEKTATAPVLAQTGGTSGQASLVLGAAASLIIGAGIAFSASLRRGRQRQA